MKRGLLAISLSGLLCGGFAALSSAQTVNFSDLTHPTTGVGTQHPAYTQNGFSLLRIPDPTAPSTNDDHFHTIAGTGGKTSADFFFRRWRSVPLFLRPDSGQRRQRLSGGNRDAVQSENLHGISDCRTIYADLFPRNDAGSRPARGLFVRGGVCGNYGVSARLYRRHRRKYDS